MDILFFISVVVGLVTYACGLNDCDEYEIQIGLSAVMVAMFGLAIFFPCRESMYVLLK